MPGTSRYREWILAVPIIFVVTVVLIPIGYLLLRSFDAEGGRFLDLFWRKRNLVLFSNTVALGAVVLFATTVLGFVFAWFSERSDVLPSRLVGVLGILPLAVPGYVLAYALLGSLGDYGLIARFTGLTIPAISGFLGSACVLSLYTFPYMFLNLRSGLAGLDPALEESAQTLGYSARETLLKVTIPQMRPAFLAGSILVLLHVLGDFGVVSLMRFETLSYAVYLQYAAAFDRTYAACLALILLLISGLLLLGEYLMLRGFSSSQSWTSPRRLSRRSPSPTVKTLARIFIFGVATISTVLPIIAIVYWTLTGSSGSSQPGASLWDSISASVPTAILAASLAVVIAFARTRRTGLMSIAAERTAYLGYATPPLAFALAFIFFTLSVLPSLYQSMIILIVALSVHFLAEAVSPIKTALRQSSVRLEEAARSLGRSGARAFLDVTFPNIRKSILAGMILVFLSVMKELPITLLLSPTGFKTLAVSVWTFTSEAQFAMAGPFALLIVLSSGCFAWLALRRHDPITNTVDISTE